MFNFSKYFHVRRSYLAIGSLALAALLLIGGTKMAYGEPRAKEIQDTAKAVQYFSEELNFKTNPHGTKHVVDGTIKNVTIVDVRTAEAFAEGHIPGAINIPYDKFNGFDGNETEFPSLRKDGFNYIYCYQLLCNLGQKAAKKFASTGYPVKEMVGGFQAWKEGGYPIEK